MRCAVLGTGQVGRALAGKLDALGHEVAMGSRSADNPAALAWADHAGPPAWTGTFADAADFGELVINATSGTASLQALSAAGEDALAGKVLIDAANPLRFSETGEMALDPANTDSLGERIQRAFPSARVVKALNTVNCQVMVNPFRVPGGHNVFVAGNDDDAKAVTVSLLKQFGWPESDVIDLGGISAARATEAYLHLWLRLMRTVGHADFNILVQGRGPAPRE